MRAIQAQFDCLAAHENGGSHGESWCAYEGAGGPTAFQWANHERMLDALTRRGLLSDYGDLTEAGQEALRRERERRSPRNVCTCDTRPHATFCLLWAPVAEEIGA
jgi:hypothetical protein